MNLGIHLWTKRPSYSNSAQNFGLCRLLRALLSAIFSSQSSSTNTPGWELIIFAGLEFDAHIRANAGLEFDARIRANRRIGPS